MKTTGTGFWSPLTIEAESQAGPLGPGHSANALEFKRSRSGGADAIAYDDLGNIFFTFRKAAAPGGWVEAASIDSRVTDVASPTGELTVNLTVAGIKREFVRCTSGYNPALADPAASARNGWVRLGPAMVDTDFFARYGRIGDEGHMTINAFYDGANWQRDNTTYGANIFQVRRDGRLWWFNAPAGGGNPTTMTPRGYTTATGDMYIDGTYNTFSPVPPKKDEEMTPDDWLAWALEDAKKPHKPYAGIPEDPEEIKKYAKVICKIAIGTARYAEHLREQLKTLEARLASLEALSSRATA